MFSTSFTNRNGGLSLPPYSSKNLAFHVGDDQEVVRGNRELVEADFGPTIYMNQVHGDSVVVVDGIPTIEVTADALVTKQSNIALAVLVADCIPLLLWDEAKSCVAAVHVGRRGLVSGIAEKTIEIMRAMGASDIHALLGPSICGRCYEVGADIYQEVVETFPVAESRTSNGTFALDLPRALYFQLTRIDVSVITSKKCTVEDLEFYSYRRDGVTGRQAGVIRL